tara:strand:- start:1928 stop:2578 length:651 start_codon:yes stop_codon:yes gene_type:complete
MITKIKFDNKWITYNSCKKSILVIGPGGGCMRNKNLYNVLRINNFLITEIHANEYDQYPNSNKNLNLNTFSKIVYRTIIKLIINNKGPSIIICGSRGGTHTIISLWENYWLGPTMVINSGCIFNKIQLPKIPIVFITMGNDYFPTSNYKETKYNIQKLVNYNYLHYYNKFDYHMPQFLFLVINELVNLLINNLKNIPEQFKNIDDYYYDFNYNNNY